MCEITRVQIRAAPSHFEVDLMSSAEEIPPVNPGFEGPEKVLEIDFTPGLGPENGLRAITRPEWDSVCTAARCTILNSLSNDKLDSYVLSESSLFVYPLKLILKTCGTTTLLKALEPLLPITEVCRDTLLRQDSSGVCTSSTVTAECARAPAQSILVLPPFRDCRSLA